MLKEIKEILRANELPTHDFIFNLCDSASSVLESEITDYRAENELGKPGSLLDFQKSPLPLVVVPDIHSRPFFIEKILDYELPSDFFCEKENSCTVFDAIAGGKCRVVCVGDALHTEVDTRERWIAAEIEFANNIYTGPAISAEMKDGLAVLGALMKLKTLFPSYVHFLKGNHENILNRTSDGDYAFVKFADEGRMVREFITEYYGEDVLYLISCIENILPLIAVSKNCVVSHAEPRFGFRKDQLVNARSDAGVVEALTWTDNDAAHKGSVVEIIEELCSLPIGKERDKALSDYVYLGGHRPVKENYKLRQNGKFIQIHNPHRQNIALVRPFRKFNPDTDIVSVCDFK